MSSLTSVAIKLTIGNEVRRIPVERLLAGEGSHPTITELKKLCVLYYREQVDLPNKLSHYDDYLNFKVSITYMDEENETIVLSTDVELLEALRFSSVPSDVGLRFLRMTAVVEPCDDYSVSAIKSSSYSLLKPDFVHPLLDDHELGATAFPQQPLQRPDQDATEPKLIAAFEISSIIDCIYEETKERGPGGKLKDVQDEKHTIEQIKEENKQNEKQGQGTKKNSSASPSTVQPVLSNFLLTITEQGESTDSSLGLKHKSCIDPLISPSDRNSTYIEEEKPGSSAPSLQRASFDDVKSAPVTPLEVVSSFLQKAGDLVHHIQIPLDQMEEIFKTKKSNPAATVMTSVVNVIEHKEKQDIFRSSEAFSGTSFGTVNDKTGALQNDESSTAVPSILGSFEVQENPSNKIDAAAGKVHETPLEAVSSFLQKAEKFVQGIQISPKAKRGNHKNQPSKTLPDDCNERVRCLGFDPNFVHARHQCDLCKCIPIVGFRWHAMYPPLTPNISVTTMRRFANFDLCHSCYTHFRENLDECSRSFEIPSEMRFRPVQYDRDCIFQVQKQANPLEMCVRQLMRCVPRFPQDQSVVRLVDCAEVNEGIRKSLKELQMKNCQSRCQNNDPSFQPIARNDEGNSLTEVLETSTSDSRPLLNVRVNPGQVDHSLMTDDGDSVQTSAMLRDAIEILSSVGSNSEYDFRDLTKSVPVETNEIYVVTNSTSSMNPLELDCDKHQLEREQNVINLVEEKIEEPELYDSHASITLGSLTVSSVADASGSKQEDTNSSNHASLYLSAQQGDMHSTAVLDLESIPFDSSVKSYSANEMSEETSFTSIEAERSEENSFSSIGAAEVSEANSFSAVEADETSETDSFNSASGTDEWDLVSNEESSDAESIGLA